MHTGFKATLAFSVFLAACGSSTTNQPSASQTPNGGSTAPSGQQASNQKKALVRFIQTVPGNEKMDVWFGDMKVFSNVAYKEVTPYVEVPAERHDFKLQTAGNTQPNALATNSEGLSAGGHYTVVAEKKTSDQGNLKLDAMNDDLTPPSAGKTKLRVINAAIGAGSIDVVDPHGKIFGGVDENTSTSYKEIAPVEGTLEIRKSDKKADILRVPNTNLQPEKLYTLVIVGGAGQPLAAIPITDQLTPPTGD